MEIKFEVSGLEPENPNNALCHYEIEFSQPVNADWLIRQIKVGLILNDMGETEYSLTYPDKEQERTIFRRRLFYELNM